MAANPNVSTDPRIQWQNKYGKLTEAEQLAKFEKEIDIYISIPDSEKKRKQEVYEDYISGYIRNIIEVTFSEFNISHFKEILMLLAKAKLTESFCSMIGAYIDDSRRKNLPAFGTIPDSEYIVIQNGLEKIGMESYINFLKQHKTDKKFMSLCGKFFLYQAVSVCIPEIILFLIDDCQISPNIENFNELDPRFVAGTLLHRISGSQRLNPGDVAQTYRSLLSRGVNAFIYEEDRKHEAEHAQTHQPKSCLYARLDGLASFPYLRAGGIFTHTLTWGILAILENGGGLLKKEIRFSSPHQLAYSESVEDYNVLQEEANVETQRNGVYTLICKEICSLINSALPSDQKLNPKEIFESLVNSEIIYLVPGTGALTLIRTVQDFFGTYVNAYEELPEIQRKSIYQMYQNIQMLTDEQAARLAPGIKEGFNNFYASRRTLCQQTALELDKYGLPGGPRANGGVQALIFSYIYDEFSDMLKVFDKGSQKALTHTENGNKPSKS